MEPVEPVEDFLTTRGTVADCSLRYFDVTRDQAGTDPWAEAIDIRGSHGVERTTGSSGTGDIVTTETTWYITAKATGSPVLERPKLQSKILSCGRVWLITDVSPNPRNRQLFECQTQLSPGG